MQVLYLGDLVVASADTIPEIARRIRLAWSCYDLFKRKVYDKEDAPFSPTVSILKYRVMRTSLYRCVAWNIDEEYFSWLRTAHHKPPLIIGLQR